MSTAPLGRVAFTFTDIEGSSLLWERVPEAMTEALTTHDQIVRAVLTAHRGYEVKTDGDAFMVVFASPVDAVHFSVELQSALIAGIWPEGLDEQPSSRREANFAGLRVRVGVHIGEAVSRPNPLTGIMDYHGPEVNRAARVCEAAHGGQVLVSGPVWDEVAPELSVESIALGEHVLRGTGVSLPLIQVISTGLGDRRFPPPRTPRFQCTNLGDEPDRFVGREDEVKQVLQRYENGVRLVSLLGPGGVGKTRLAQRVGRAAFGTGKEKGGVWFCDLADADSRQRIVDRVARTLQVPLTAPTHAISDHVEQLGRALQGHGRLFLVLDNFEQIVGFAEETLGQWLKQAPELRVLVTTRERLGLQGEHIYDTSPLSVDDAAELFCERARKASPTTRFDPDCVDIRAVVSRLDGLPLAIELAAARCELLRPEQLLNRLNERFRLLRGRKGERPDRQVTLRAAIDGSWQALSPEERQGLAQLSVFRGGFTLEAAEAVVDLSEFSDPPWTIDVVGALSDKSLVCISEPRALPGERCYGLLESIRTFASEHLGGPQCALAQARHAQTVVGTAEQWVSGLQRAGGLIRLRRLELEVENLLAAWRRNALDDPDLALRAVLALDQLLYLRGPFEHHLSLLEKAVDVSKWGSVRLQASVRRARGKMLRRIGAAVACREATEEALAIARQAGDARLVAQIVSNLGDVCLLEGRIHDASARYRDALCAFERIGDDVDRGFVLANLGASAMLSGDFDEADRVLHTALALHRSVGDRRSEGLTLTNLGQLAAERRDFALASTHFEAALSIHEQLRDRGSQSTVLVNLGNVELERGRFDAAAECYDHALVLARETGSRWGAGLALGNRALLRHFQGDLQEATTDVLASVEHFSGAGDRRGEGYFRLHAVSVLADAGQLEAARVHHDLGAELLSQIGDPIGGALAGVVCAHLMVRSGPGSSSLEAANAALQVVQSTETGTSVAEQSADIRFACDLLQNALAATKSAAG